MDFFPNFDPLHIGQSMNHECCKQYVLSIMRAAHNILSIMRAAQSILTPELPTVLHSSMAYCISAFSSHKK